MDSLSKSDESRILEKIDTKHIKVQSFHFIDFLKII